MSFSSAYVNLWLKICIRITCRHADLHFCTSACATKLQQAGGARHINHNSIFLTWAQRKNLPLYWELEPIWWIIFFENSHRNLTSRETDRSTKQNMTGSQPTEETVKELNHPGRDFTRPLMFTIQGIILIMKWYYYSVTACMSCSSYGFQGRIFNKLWRTFLLHSVWVKGPMWLWEAIKALTAKNNQS